MLQTALQNFTLKGKSLLPIVQGGMGVGVSAHRLAGTVASLGAMGTISSVDQRRHHDDLMEQTSGRLRDKDRINEANLVALDREIKKGLELSEGRGMIAVNIMRAVSEYARSVRQACESGAHAVVVGAGLPLDLPDLTKDFAKVAIIPVLSDVRGISLLVKKWMRKNRLPDAIVIENPHFAAGHLGIAKTEDLQKGDYDSPSVVENTLQLFKDLDIESENIPLIVAGGVHTHEQMRDLLAHGANAVQLGTAFAVSQEGDAHINFKKTLAEARPEDTVTFTSTAGLPARAVRTPWLENYLAKLDRLQDIAKPRPCTAGFDCLIQCGFRDGISNQGQFCIDTQLAFALKGDIKRGLFFRSSEPLPFGSAIRPVKELIDYMLTGLRPGSQVEAA